MARKVESVAFLSSAQQEFKKGNVREANALLNQGLANNGNNDEKSQKDLKNLESELKRAQSSNLLNAQRADSADNFKRYNGGAKPLDAPMSTPQISPQAKVASRRERSWSMTLKSPNNRWPDFSSSRKLPWRKYSRSESICPLTDKNSPSLKYCRPRQKKR